MPLTRDVLRSLGPIAASAPRELSTISFVMSLPPAPFVPPHLVGTPAVGIMFVYAGDPGEGQAAIAPFRQVATPLAEVVMPMPYPGIYEFLNGAEAPAYASHRSVFLPAIDDAVVDTILEFHAAATSPMALTQLRILGGAMADVADDATAFGHRDAGAMLIILGMYEDPSEAAIHADWVHRFYEAVRPTATGVYVNFLEDEGDGRIREAYRPATYARLAQVKRRYDPTNLFHRNQNIRPAADA